jgi:hypothetical protein
VRTGRPPTYSAEQRSAVITAALTRATELGSRRLNAPPPTGMSTSIPSSGDAVGAIGNPAGSVSRLSPLSH